MGRRRKTDAPRRADGRVASPPAAEKRRAAKAVAEAAQMKEVIASLIGVSPLKRLALLGFITAEEFEAGELWESLTRTCRQIQGFSLGPQSGALARWVASERYPKRRRRRDWMDEFEREEAEAETLQHFAEAYAAVRDSDVLEGRARLGELNAIADGGEIGDRRILKRALQVLVWHWHLAPEAAPPAPLKRRSRAARTEPRPEPDRAPAARKRRRK